MRPTASMSFGRSSSIWRLQVRQAGRHLLGLRVAVARRAALEHVGDVDVARAVEPDGRAASHPAAGRPRPTKGSPRRSSSAPGASPMTSQSTRSGPTPNTPWVRVWCSGQRVQVATCVRSASQRAAKSAAGALAARSAGAAAATGSGGAAGGAGGRRGLHRRTLPARHPPIDAERLQVLPRAARRPRSGTPRAGGPRTRRRTRRPTHSSGAESA